MEMTKYDEKIDGTLNLFLPFHVLRASSVATAGCLFDTITPNILYLELVFHLLQHVIP